MILTLISSLTRAGGIIVKNHHGYQPVYGGDAGVRMYTLFGRSMSDMGVVIDDVIAGRPKRDHTESITEHMVALLSLWFRYTYCGIVAGSMMCQHNYS